LSSFFCVCLRSTESNHSKCTRSPQNIYIFTAIKIYCSVSRALERPLWAHNNTKIEGRRIIYAITKSRSMVSVVICSSYIQPNEVYIIEFWAYSFILDFSTRLNSLKFWWFKIILWFSLSFICFTWQGVFSKFSMYYFEYIEILFTFCDTQKIWTNRFP
jgi:hypothetical protein